MRLYAKLMRMMYVAELNKCGMYSAVFSFDTIQHDKPCTFVNLNHLHRLTTNDIIYYTGLQKKKILNPLWTIDTVSYVF